MEKRAAIAKMKADKGKKVEEKAGEKMVRKRHAIRKSMIEQTASITGKSETYVRKVMDGNRNSDEVELVYMELVEGNKKLVEAVKALVPFNGYQDIELEVRYKRFD